MGDILKAIEENMTEEELEARAALVRSMAGDPCIYGVVDAPKPRTRRAFNPGPASTSRKKRKQIGAYVKHVRVVTERGARPVPKPKSLRRAKRVARRAMGASGVSGKNPRGAGRGCIRGTALVTLSVQVAEPSAASNTP